MRELIDDVAALDAVSYRGRVAAVNGLMIEATGPVSGLTLGARAHIGASDGPACEIVGFRDGRAVMMPLDPTHGVSAGAELHFSADPPCVRPSNGWLGRVIDAMGEPADGGPALPQGATPRLLVSGPPPAQTRGRVGDRIDLGVRALNVFAPLCRGQRLGLFAGSGVGKSVLMSMLARGAEADVVVIGLIGERGREVREFVEDTLGEEGLKRSVVVVATSDEPALRRRQAAHLTLTVAEHFRDQGLHVLCLMDSVTRFALAQREIGLASGEPPTTRGYTPSVFAELPKLLERAGPGCERADGKPPGAVTAIFTVLVEGGDHDEPVADAVRGVLDGHIVMDRAIAERGRFPAIDVLKSVSRTMPGCAAPDEQKLIRKARKLLSTFTDMEELIRLGAYARGSDKGVDEAIRVQPALEDFLSQDGSDQTSMAECFERLAASVDSQEQSE